MTFSDTLLEFLNSELFGYLLHAAEIIIAELIFGVLFRKRKYFVLRLVLSLAVFMALSGVLGTLVEMVFPYFSYLVSFVLSLFVMPLCFRGKVWDELFCCVTGVVIQNLSYSISCFVAALCGWDPVVVTFSSAAVQVVIYVLVHAACDIYCLSKLKADKNGFGVESISLIIMAIVMVVVVYLLQHDRQSLEAEDYFVWRITFICFDVLILFMFFGMYDRGQLKKQNEVLDNLRQQASVQYEMDQKSIEVINVKCHDLKNQIASIRSLGVNDRESALSDVEDAVMIYDALAKTGNKSLDVVLSNKCLICEKAGIRLTYIVDGEALLFMNPVDIFSLFGNALDNAIRAVSGVEDERKRVINMSGRKYGGFLFINIENYCDRDITFVNGLPVTSQEDKTIHGYGMLSMKRIAETYGGVMEVHLKDHIFSVSFTIPIPAKQEGKKSQPSSGQAADGQSA